MPNVLIVGCGTNIHANHNYPVGWTEYTIDIDVNANATYTMDITSAPNLGLLSNHHRSDFEVVRFESIPLNVFSDRLTSLAIMNTLDQILVPNGRVLIRTGSDAEKEVATIKKVFRAWNYDDYGDIRDAKDETVDNLDLAANRDFLGPYVFCFEKVAAARRRPAEV